MAVLLDPVPDLAVREQVARQVSATMALMASGPAPPAWQRQVRWARRCRPRDWNEMLRRRMSGQARPPP